MKLIDADKLDEYLGEWADEFYENKENADADFMDGYCMTLNKILSSKVLEIDAVPVVHGKWTADESTYTDGEAQCSVCKTTYYADDLYEVGEQAQSELPNYCPHCGARMDAE